MNKTALLCSLGVEKGNTSLEIEDMEGYFAREKAENMLATGFDVPEEFLPRQRGRKERDLYRRMKDMERLESTRVYSTSQVFQWTDSDEQKWIEHLKDNGYGMLLEDRVTGAIEEVKLLNKEQGIKRHQNRWLAAKLSK